MHWAGVLAAVWCGGLLAAAAADGPGKTDVQQKQSAPVAKPAAGDEADASAVPGLPKPAPVPRERAVETEHVPPPKPLHKVGDHWTPYDPPTPAEGAEVHVIVAGETLWGLADKAYGDPYLWPAIWDANRWITHSHWIYPGDPLVMPGPQHVITEEGPAPAPQPEPEPEPEPAPAPAPAPAGPRLYAAIDGSELACTAQLLDEFDPSPLTIAGREERSKTLLGTGDIVYLSAGRDMQLKAGAEYAVERPDGVLKHPATHQPHAVYVRRLGRVRVIAVQANTATAEVTLACSAIHDGDSLVPYRDLPVPMIQHVPMSQVEAAEVRQQGAVIVTKDPAARLAGTGDLVGIDVGSRGGATSGERVLFWHKAPGNGLREAIAQGVVVSTNGGGSMVKVLEANTEIQEGDGVDLM